MRRLNPPLPPRTELCCSLTDGRARCTASARCGAGALGALSSVALQWPARCRTTACVPTVPARRRTTSSLRAYCRPLRPRQVRRQHVAHHPRARRRPDHARARDARAALRDPARGTARWGYSGTLRALTCSGTLRSCTRPLQERTPFETIPQHGHPWAPARCAHGRVWSRWATCARLHRTEPWAHPAHGYSRVLEQDPYHCPMRRTALPRRLARLGLSSNVFVCLFVCL